ncbi:hypothetical protein MMC13_000258 [Lambiella insularis]|nr:hypothetical protein [Lambiella insularis]
MHLSPSAALLVLSTVIAPITSSVIPVSNPPEPSVTSFPPTATPEAAVHRIASLSSIGFENLAVRSNGEILATTAFPWALLWSIDPLSIRPPVLLQNFTALSGTFGIIELAPDMFYFVGTGTDGPHNVYSVDMRLFLALPNGTILTPPVIREIGSIPAAVALNGMTHLHQSDHFVLIADTALGGVWRFDVKSGQCELIIQDPSMKGPANKTSFAGFGINGLRTQNSTLFYTNSGGQTMYKMPLHSDGSPAGNATLITSGLSCDDFALDAWGFAYVASPSNALIRVDTRTGAQLAVAGTFDDTVSDIVSASSVRFGRGPSDRASVYVTTNGGSSTDAPLGSQGISRVDVGDLAEVLRWQGKSW